MLLTMCTPCSKKFWRKVHFISTFQDLSCHVQLEEQYISAPASATDKLIMSRRPTGHKYMTGQQGTDTKQTRASSESSIANAGTTDKSSERSEIPIEGVKNEE